MDYYINELPLEAELYNLYHSVGWFNYLSCEYKLTAMLEQSSYFVTVKHDNQLVGLIRALTDGISIVYIQDLLVLPEYQNKGVGKQLLNYVLKQYNGVRQIVLTTDNDPTKKYFYEKSGLFATIDFNCISYMKLNM